MWVRQNGLYPQAGGAPLRKYCMAVDIDFKTHQRWMNNSNYSDAIKRAQQDFRTSTVEELVNTLKKSALGYNVTTTDAEFKAQVVREYDPKTGKKVKEYTTDKGVRVKEQRKETHVQPNVGAAIFLLTNLDPDNWKNKQDLKADMSLDFEEAPVIVFSDSPSSGADDSPASEKEPEMM